MVLTNPPFTLFLGRGQDSVSQGISADNRLWSAGGPGTMDLCVYIYVFVWGQRERERTANNLQFKISFHHSLSHTKLIFTKTSARNVRSFQLL